MKNRRSKNNPGYTVPKTTVFLGTVLDLDVEYDSTRIRIEEFEGWNMLVSQNAETTAPGYGKIYLVKGNLRDTDSGIITEEGAETYEMWTGRDPEKLAELNTPEAIAYWLGRVNRIGYRSDRGQERGQVADFDHYFIEYDGKAPYIYTDIEDFEVATAAVIVGGDFIITERGIE